MPELPELVFLLAPGQNAFFVELAEAFAFELNVLGVPVRIHEGPPPAFEPSCVYILLPPHEYVALMGHMIPDAILERSITISAEQPESSFFQSNLDIVSRAGAVFDINRRATEAYIANAVDAKYLPLGYSQFWASRQSQPERDIDVVFLGRFTPRRSAALAKYADILERFECRLMFSDNSKPNTATSGSFVSSHAKHELLRRSKVLLNIHGDGEPYVEWLRIVEAASAGCAIVSENSTHTEPFVAGRHFVSGRISSLGHLVAFLVEDSAARQSYANSALDALKKQPLAHAARELWCSAESLVARTPRRTVSLWVRHYTALYDAARCQLSGKQALSPLSQLTAGGDPALRALKRLHLGTLDLRRRLEGLELLVQAPGRTASDVYATIEMSRTSAWDNKSSRAVAIVIPVYNHADAISSALASLERLDMTDWEAVIVDDGSKDNLLDTVTGWMERRDDLAVKLVRHPVNRGLGAARNTGVSCCSSDMILMLDADNELRPAGLGRLVRALESQPSAAFAYGILDTFDSDGPKGLLSIYGWEPSRLAAGNYIDALALVRRSALEAVGGYTTDSRLYGWEDYDLWVRLADRGCAAVFVPQIVARYHCGDGSMISETNVSAVDAVIALKERAPQLMMGDLRRSSDRAASSSAG